MLRLICERDFDSYLAYDGNGGVEAMQQTFRPGDEILVEVGQYRCQNSTKILHQFNPNRRLNGLLV